MERAGLRLALVEETLVIGLGRLDAVPRDTMVIGDEGQQVLWPDRVELRCTLDLRGDVDATQALDFVQFRECFVGYVTAKLFILIKNLQTYKRIACFMNI